MWPLLNIRFANICHISLLAFGLALLSSNKTEAQTPFACTDQFFLTLSDNASSLNEVVFNDQTGAVEFLSINTNLGLEVNAAGYRFTDNLIYCIDPQRNRLVRIDGNGQAAVLANLPLNPNNVYFAGDITPDGRYLMIIGSLFLVTGPVLAADLVKIDLEDPNYGITTIPVNVQAQIFDIAFHPVTGELYGYDSASRRLIKIDPDKGTITAPFQATNAPVATGSLFFNAYGDLYAYGSPSINSDQNSLYKIDINTGASTFLTKGDPATASDGCSCPYTVELRKTVMPGRTLPCTQVEYTLEIVNRSNRTQEGIRLEDHLPAGFTFVGLSENPLGGNLLSVPGDDWFILDAVDLPPGEFKIKIRVYIGQVNPGVYNNQARLLNLPASLGDSRLSDNPATFIPDDSTAILVEALNFDTIFLKVALCEGEAPVQLDPAPYLSGITTQPAFTWQDGSTRPYFDVDFPGDYHVAIVLGCDTAHIFYDVVFSSIDVSILTPDNSTILLGDSLFLTTSVFNTEPQTIYQWVSEQAGAVRCPSCAETWVRPFNDMDFKVVVQNDLGCRDSASVRVKVEKNRDVYFPNVLMPASDNEANRFFYAFSGDRSLVISRLMVYSRWGELMFEARDISPNDMFSGWDGTFRGESAMPGVYTWVARVAFLDGERLTYSGDVTLVR